MSGQQPIPVTVLTGFLGSGKTTLLNRLLLRPDMKGTAVIVNEFGEIGIDDVLIARSSSDAVLLSSGCICCSMKDDLTQTLQDLLVQVVDGKIPAFDRVVIETTGLADPGPILHILMRDPAVTARYRMGGVVTTVDAVNGLGTLDRHGEAVHQAAVADRLLLTKTDLAGPEAARQIETRLRDLNPAAGMFKVIDGEIEPSRLFDIGLFKIETKTIDVQGWLGIEGFARRDAHSHGHDHHHHEHGDDCGPDCEHDHDHAHHPHSHHDHGIQSFSIVRDRPVSWDSFTHWLESVTLRRGPDLLCMKGIINIAEHPGEPVVIHGVQDVFHPPVQLESWPTDDHRTRIVFITRNIERASLENTLVHFEVSDTDQSSRAPQESRKASQQESSQTKSHQHLDKIAS